MFLINPYVYSGVLVTTTVSPGTGALTLRGSNSPNGFYAAPDPLDLNLLDGPTYSAPSTIDLDMT